MVDFLISYIHPEVFGSIFIESLVPQKSFVPVYLDDRSYPKRFSSSIFLSSIRVLHLNLNLIE